MLTKSSNNLVWIDLEMTGLDFENDVILEIATVITSKSLKNMQVGPHFAIHYPTATLDAMNEWCLKTHKKSGLYDRCVNSQVSLKQAEAETLAFIKQYCEPNKSPLCGNSICTDRRFLCKFMPDIDQFLHYRQIDVTSISLLAKNWRFDIKRNSPNKQKNHLALDDILESIKELKYYRDHWLQ